MIPALICIFTGAALMAVFLFPLSMIHMNVGSMAGLAISAILILYGLFRRRLPKKLRLGVKLAALAFILAALGLGLVMRFGAKHAPEEGKEVTVIVLGCRVNGTVPSLMLESRIHAARDFLLAHPEAKCICSGGQGSDERISEAACIYRELKAAGIEESRLYVEDRSTSTEENLAFSKKIIEEKDLCRHVAVVTNEFHCYRGLCMAKDAGLEADSVSAGTALYLLPTYFLRECAAILWMWVSG